MLVGGVFTSDLTVEGLLRNAPRTSPTATGSLAMGGQAGVTSPVIVTARLADPDNGDTMLSQGDTLTVVFDMHTNQGGEGLLTRAGSRVLVDKLFAFSHSLGSRYTGRWLGPAAFEVTLVDTSGNNVPSQLGLAFVSVTGDIKSANELSRWCKATAPLSGSAGTRHAPYIEEFVSQTWDLQEAGWSRYDTLSVTFDLPTDRGSREGGKAFVDTTLGFSQPLGADYSGVWRDASTFKVTVLDAAGAGEGPKVNASGEGALVTVMGVLHNAPGTSPRSEASYRMRVGNFGQSGETPKLLRFFARDHDNANASYDSGDQLVVQFDMATNRGACLTEVVSYDNLPYCARRAAGGSEYVDSLLTLSSPMGANYSGVWEDSSTFVLTVVQSLPGAEHAPRPYDTVLKLSEEAAFMNVAETAPPLSFGPVALGVAERFEMLPRPPRLVDAYASDFTNTHLLPASGDTIAIRFDVPTDRANGIFDEYAGHISCQAYDPDCRFMDAQAHRLFDFYDSSGSRLTTPFFIEYTTGWFDDSTFVIAVVNGTRALQPGILDATWIEGRSALVDSGTRVALREGVVVQSKNCPAEYMGTVYCTAPTGLSNQAEGSPAYGYKAPHLHGDFGRVTGPRIVSFAADDPDNGDGVFGDGDVLTITFDQRTNRGRTHTNFGRAYATVYDMNGESETVPYPLGTDGLSGTLLVDALFIFSHPLGTSYTGQWLDDSTFEVTVVDSSGHDASNPPRVDVVNVTARPSGGVAAFNLTAKTCFNLTDMLLHHGEDYYNLMYRPDKVNSSSFDCELHYANSTSPRLMGDLGLPTYPTLLSAVVDDVDNGDEVYGKEDVIVLQFDMPTNRPAGLTGGTNATGNVKTAVDALFAFSSNLGEDYSGEWVHDDRFVVTIIDTTGGSLEVEKTAVTVVSQGIRNAAGDALTANNQTITIHGDFGTLAEPAILRLTVVVAANATNYTDGDTMVVHMDMLTNFGGGTHGLHGDKAYVDHLFGFSHVLGANYSGTWEGGETPPCAAGGLKTIHPCFVITMIDARGGAAISGSTIAAPSVHLRSASGTSATAGNRLSGDRGRRLAPLLVDLRAEDDDNSAAGIDVGDSLTLVFDVPTNVAVTPPQPWGDGVGGGATSGDGQFVDSLFRFCTTACPLDAGQPSGSWLDNPARARLGMAYSGAWRDESTFTVTLVDPTGNTLALGETVAQARAAESSEFRLAATPRRTVRFRGGISDFSNSTSPVLRGTFGVDDAPTISAFVARDADHADTEYGAFDELRLIFSMATDRGHLPELRGDKRFVDRYFEFACNLGLDYSGAWDEPAVATVTILDGTVGHSPAALWANDDLALLRVAPSPNSLFKNKPGTSSAAPTAVRPPEPPLRGSQFPENAGTQLCAASEFCDFGDFCAAASKGIRRRSRQFGVMDVWRSVAPDIRSANKSARRERRARLTTRHFGSLRHLPLLCRRQPWQPGRR